MQPSSFIKRVLAFIVDLVVINVGVMFLGDLALRLTGNKIDPEKLKVTQQAFETGGVVDMAFVQTLMDVALILSLVSVVVVVVVDAILPATKMMASPGKHLLGMAITDMNGKRIGFGKSIGRHAAKFVSCITIIGFCMPLWSKQKQALHDAMCATLVVNKKGLAKT